MSTTTDLLITAYNKLEAIKALKSSLSEYLTNEIIEDLKKQKKQVDEELKAEIYQLEEKEECKIMREKILEAEEILAEIANNLYSSNEPMPEAIETTEGKIKVNDKTLKHIFIGKKELKNRAYQLKLL